MKTHAPVLLALGLFSLSLMVVGCVTTAPMQPTIVSNVSPALPTGVPQTPPTATRVPPLQSRQRPPAQGTLPSSPGGTSYTVINPTTHAKLAVKVFAPRDATGEKLPALVLVPGGTGDGKVFEADAAAYNAAGLVMVLFDPDGRGQSTGTEDYGGYKQQDGLAAVIRFVATLPQVDAKKIGLVNQFVRHYNEKRRACAGS